MLFRKLVFVAALAVVIVGGAGYFIGQNKHPVVEVTPGFCEISNWGPRTTRVGAGFNVQPDGNSALWVSTSCYPDDVAISVAGQAYKTVQYPTSLTAAITDTSTVSKAGDIEVSLLNKATGRRQHVGMLTVTETETETETKQSQTELNLPNVAPPLFIAHAAGGFEGRRYRNSMEALERNHELGHRFFELDFSWTSDKQLVGIHDWKNSYRRLFKEADHESAPSYKQLLSLTMDNNETIVTMPRLKQWLADNPSSYIVTDIKGYNVRALKLMKRELGEQYKQVIPQLYHPKNYQELRELGYRNIIFTLYATHIGTEKIISFVADNPLVAVTVHPKKPGFAEMVPAFNALDRFVYVHTYNTLADYDKYTAMGVDGLYTDFLYQDANGDIQAQ
jgi:glycerophosphoryl diester phosphodiesterase